MRRHHFIVLTVLCGIILSWVASPAGALPPRRSSEPRGDIGDIGGGAGPTTSTTAPGSAGRILGFTVSSDSVVATATVHQDGTATRATVRWGDGSESTRTPNDIRTTVLGGQPWGPILTFQHVYAEPQDKKAFLEFVTASVEGPTGTDVSVLGLTITPTYDVVQFDASFRPLEHCDSIFEDYTEWKIVQSIDGHEVASWRQDRMTNGGIISYDFQRLPGSAVVRQMAVADPGVSVTYHVTELDPWFDDVAGTVGIYLHPTTESKSYILSMDEDCEAQIQADVQVTLRKPGLIVNDTRLPVMSAAS